MYIEGVFVLIWIATVSEGKVNLLHIDHDYSQASGQPEGYYIFDDTIASPSDEIARSERSLFFGNKNMLGNNNMFRNLLNYEQGCTKCCPPGDVSQATNVPEVKNENVDLFPTSIPKFPIFPDMLGRPLTIPQLPCLSAPGYQSQLPISSPPNLPSVPLAPQQWRPLSPQNKLPEVPSSQQSPRLPSQVQVPQSVSPQKSPQLAPNNEEPSPPVFSQVPPQQQLPQFPYQIEVPSPPSGQPIFSQAQQSPQLIYEVPLPSYGQPPLPQALAPQQTHRHTLPPQIEMQSPPAGQPIFPQLPPLQRLLPQNLFPFLPNPILPRLPSFFNRTESYSASDSQTNLRPISPPPLVVPEQFRPPPPAVNNFNEAIKNIEIEITHENREKQYPKLLQPVIYVQPSYVISPQDKIYTAPPPSVFYDPSLPPPQIRSQNYNNLRNWCIQNFSGPALKDLPSPNTYLSEMYSSESQPQAVISDSQPLNDCSEFLQEYNSEIRMPDDNAPGLQK